MRKRLMVGAGWAFALALAAVGVVRLRRRGNATPGESQDLDGLGPGE